VDAGYRHVRSIQGHWAGVVRLDWGASPISSADAVVWMLQSSGEERELRHWSLTLKQARNSELTCELIEPEKVQETSASFLEIQHSTAHPMILLLKPHPLPPIRG
jgi:hypothetical protein